jgi:RHS repeat-associated protein
MKHYYFGRGKMNQRVCILPLSILTVLFLATFSYAATPSISINVQDDGGVLVTATGSYESCPPGHTGHSISLSYYSPGWGNSQLCSSGGASCSVVLDRAGLNGTIPFTATASDCSGSSTASQSLTFDNTPQLSYGGPTGTVSAPFDIYGSVVFTPTLNNVKGNVTFYLDGSFLGITQNCYTYTCNFSYQGVKGSLYQAYQGTHVVKVVAAGGGVSVNAQNTITVDMTPTVALTSPAGTVSSPFDITGTAVFKPTLGFSKGTVSFYIDGSSLGVTQNCTTENCNFSYQSVKGSLYDPWAGSHTVKVVASANGANASAQNTITVDRTPTVTVSDPTGTVATPFDITGTVTFKPSLGSIKGSVTFYLDGSSTGVTQNCTAQTCNFSYQSVKGSLLSTSAGSHTVRVDASSMGAGVSKSNSFKAEACNLAVSTSTVSPISIDPYAGASTAISSNISGLNSGDPLNWTVAIGGKNYSGTSTTALATWDGRDAQGRPLSPGTYTATLTAQSVPYCSKTKTAQVTIAGQAVSTAHTKTLPEGTVCKNNPEIQMGSTGNAISGNLFNSVRLFNTPNSKLMHEFGLSYNSLDSRTVPLGIGWTHTYNISLTQNNNGTYTLSLGDGTQISLGQKGTYYAPVYSAYPQLLPNGDGTFSLSWKDGTVYSFNSSKAITAITDRNQNAVTFSYSGGNVAAITDPSGRTIVFAYSGAQISTITDFAGNIHTLTYSGGNLTQISSQVAGLGARVWNFSYDPSGYMTSKTDPAGFGTGYAYDTSHRLIQATDPQFRIRTLAYTPASQQAQLTEKDGGLWTYQYDPSIGMLTQKSDPLGNSLIYSYDADKNLVSVVDPKGNVTSYAYDVNENITSMTDALNHTTLYTYNALNKPVTIANPDNTTVGMAYDSRGNLTSVTDQIGAVTQYVYDSHGNLASVTDALNNVTALSYNPQGYLASITEPTGAVTALGYDSAGNMVSVTDALGHVTSYQYNGLGKVTQITDPEGHATLFAYDLAGNTASVTDGNGLATAYTYNYQGQATSTTDAAGNVTTLTYGGTGCPSCGSGVDKLTALTDAKGNITNFLYDLAGRLTRQTNPTGSYKSYSYDPASNLTSVTDENGNTTSYTHDALNRLTQESFPGGSSKTFGYDSMGRMVSAGNPNISYTILRDTVGRPLTVTDSNGRAVIYSYDALGRRTQLTTPDSRTMTYSYDAGSSLNQIQAGTDIFGFSYDLQGWRTALNFPNGISTTYSYSAASNLTGINITTSQQTLINQFLHTFDNARNKTSLTDLAGLHNYSYDPTYQLTQATHPSPDPTEQFSYDFAGNRTGTTVTANNSLLEDSVFIYSYDSNGNLTSKTEKATGTVTTYGYDYENKLASVTSPGLSAQYQYDPFGRRIQKTVNGVTTKYAYDGSDIVTQYDGAGNPIAGYVFSLAIDDPLSVTQAGGTYFYHKDSLGSITDLTDSTGNAVQSYDYGSFGNIVGTSGTLTQPFTFTGREFDAETGLYYYRARYYDAKAGRFISRDPLGFAAGDVNTYRYVGNSFPNYVDPWGLEFITPQDAQALIVEFKTWIGTPYKSGRAIKGAQGGTDCSWSTHHGYVNANFPYDYSQTKNFATNPSFKPAPKNIPQLGDIALWGDHMAVYAGNGEIYTAHRPGISYSLDNLSNWIKDKGANPIWYRYYKPDK